MRIVGAGNLKRVVFHKRLFIFSVQISEVSEKQDMWHLMKGQASGDRQKRRLLRLLEILDMFSFDTTSPGETVFSRRKRCKV
jgi:hypothetical protein